MIIRTGLGLFVLATVTPAIAQDVPGTAKPATVQACAAPVDSTAQPAVAPVPGGKVSVQDLSLRTAPTPAPSGKVSMQDMHRTTASSQASSTVSSTCAAPAPLKP